MTDTNANANANGGGARRSKNRRRRGKSSAGGPPRPSDLWRPVAQLPLPDPIVPAPDPTAFIRSLGDPPLHGQGAVAEHHLALAVAKAAGLAAALAASAGLLASGNELDA